MSPITSTPCISLSNLSLALPKMSIIYSVVRMPCPPVAVPTSAVRASECYSRRSAVIADIFGSKRFPRENFIHFLTYLFTLYLQNRLRLNLSQVQFLALMYLSSYLHLASTAEWSSTYVKLLHWMQLLPISPEK